MTYLCLAGRLIATPAEFSAWDRGKSGQHIAAIWLTASSRFIGRESATENNYPPAGGQR